MDLSHRKVSKRIRFTDENGIPAADKEIRIKQTNHSFLFGCGAFEFLQYAGKGDEDYKEAAKRFLDVFNYGTIPVYWGAYEPEEGHTDQDMILKTARYLTDRNVKVKGHPLCWHTVCADWLLKYDNDTILNKQLGRIKREVTTFKGVIDIWDVINEVVIMPVFDKYDNAITRICKEKGRVGLVREVFAMAHECNPDAMLLINDFNTSRDYEMLIDDCLSADIPISAIGIQSHQHQGYWGREKLEQVLNRYERFGLPIHFTENTLISGELMPGHIVDLNDWQVDKWPSTPEGEERQAREIEEMYSILFSHPLVEAITAWDLRDGGWLKAPSGLIRKDSSVKPAYEVLKDLITRKWHTDETITADENGYVLVSAFKGEYEMSMGDKTARMSLLDDEPASVVLKTDKQ